jgi:hypothetical protein
MKKAGANKKEAISVVGVWQITEIGRQNAGSPRTDKPFPNIFIFTRRHYSMAWVAGENANRAFAQRWNPTNDEKIERFDSMVVNAGTYEVKGSVLMAHPVVARIPDFIGGKLICEFHVDEDTMRLRFIDECSFDGVQAPWVKSGGLVLTLVRIG